MLVQFFVNQSRSLHSLEVFQMPTAPIKSFLSHSLTTRARVFPSSQTAAPVSTCVAFSGADGSFKLSSDDHVAHPRSLHMVSIA